MRSHVITCENLRVPNSHVNLYSRVKIHMILHVKIHMLIFTSHQVKIS